MVLPGVHPLPPRARLPDRHLDHPLPEQLQRRQDVRRRAVEDRGVPAVREARAGPVVLVGAEEQHLHRPRLRVRPAPAGLHLRLPHLPQDRQVRRVLAGGPVHAAIISVIVIGIMWAIIFSPNGLIAEVIEQMRTPTPSPTRSPAIFNAAGGFNITDELVKQLIHASGPVAGADLHRPAGGAEAAPPHLQPDQLDHGEARPREPPGNEVDARRSSPSRTWPCCPSCSSCSGAGRACT